MKSVIITLLMVGSCLGQFPIPDSSTGGSSGGGGVNASNNSVAVPGGPFTTLNFAPTAGLWTWGLTPSGTTLSIQPVANGVASISQIQTGNITAVVSASGSGTTYTGCPTTASVSAYNAHQFFQWYPDVNGTAGAVTLNICGLGAKAVYEADGVTNPTSTDIVANRMILIWYDTTINSSAGGFRMYNTPAASGVLSSAQADSWYNSVVWGDSLTAGTDGNGTTVTSVLTTLLGIPSPYGSPTVFNGGVGGQESQSIGVREGGISTTVTVTGGTIPTSGGVTVTFPSGFEPVTSQGPLAGTMGTIMGVFGNVTLSGATYTFTRAVNGGSVAVSGSVPFTVYTASLNGGFVHLWAGRNDTGNVSSATTEANIASMVSVLPKAPKRYLVWAIINAEGEGTGTANYNQIIATNSNSASVYSGNYLDVRAYLVSLYNSGNPVDVIDHTNDIPPYTLRGTAITSTLSSAITTTSACPVDTTKNFGANQIVAIGSEYIYILTVSGSPSQPATCTRGYAGTTATTYASATAYTASDNIHLNAAGYTAVANYVYSWLVSHDPGVNGYTATLAGIQGVFASPPPIGQAAANAVHSTSLYAIAPGTTDPLGTCGVFSFCFANDSLHLHTANGNSAGIMVGSPSNSEIGYQVQYDFSSFRWRFISQGGFVGYVSVSGIESPSGYLKATPPATTLTGTTGTGSCSQAIQGTLKISTCYLNAYANTSTAQTYSFPAAFSTTPILQLSGGSCGTYNPSVTASTLTLPANAAMTAETCNVVVIGQ